MITKFKLLEQPTTMIPIKDIITFTGKNKQFYFHIRANNNRIIIPSEGYKSKQSRTKTIKLIQASLKAEVPVVERVVVKAKAVRSSRVAHR